MQNLIGLFATSILFLVRIQEVIVKMKKAIIANTTTRSFFVKILKY